LMDVGEMSSSARVVVFSHDSALGRFGREVVRVASAYEAAAELLDGGVRVLVIDLRALTDRHVRLLDVAREMGVEMLAVGALPAHLSSDELNGVRLIAHDQLDQAVGRYSREVADEAKSAEPIGVDPDLLARVLAPGGEAAAEPVARPARRPLRPAPDSGPRPDGGDDAHDNPMCGRSPIFGRPANGGAERGAMTESLDVTGEKTPADTDGAVPPTLGTDALLTADELAGLLGDETC
jgi:hypothetical protein